MIKKVETLEEANKCDELLNKLILDEMEYDDTINENFIVNNYFFQIIKNKDNILLVDKIDEKIIAYIFAKRIYDNSTEKIGYLIDGLYVEPEYRNHGIAKNLISEIINICKDNNASYIDINVVYKNLLAKKLYKSLEFSEFKLTLRKELN